MRRMKSGHYVTYVHMGDVWYELNDEKITALPSPPTRFPYIVFLTQVAASLHMIGMRTPDEAVQRLLQARARGDGRDSPREGGRKRRSGDFVGSGSGKRSAMKGVVQEGTLKTERSQTRDRSGRDQDGSGRDQGGRDQDRSGRDQSGRDQSGQDPRIGRAWGSQSGGDNRDNSRSDAFNSIDNQFQRYIENWPRRRTSEKVTCRTWSHRAEPTLPQPCRLCSDGFAQREDFVKHVNDEHGGLQRYRNALFCLLALKPYIVKGQEWRSILANLSESYSRSAMDWEGFTDKMQELTT